MKKTTTTSREATEESPRPPLANPLHRCLMGFAPFILLLMCTGILAAKGKPGGGGGDPPPPPPAGVLYFISGTDVQSANSDGSNAQTLFTGKMYGTEPSHQLHGGMRWFLEFQAIPGQTYPDGRQRFEVFAVSETGLELQISDDPNLEMIDPNQGDLPVGDWASLRWTVDDQAVSFQARRWGLNGSNENVIVEKGLYRVDVGPDVSTFSGRAVPARVNVAFATRFYGTDDSPYEAPDVLNHDWDLNGLLVYTSTTGLHLADPATGSQLFLSAGSGDTYPYDYPWNVRWSPDGSTILFGQGPYYTISPDGSGLSQVIEIGSWWAERKEIGRARFARWSPTGKYFVFSREKISDFNRKGPPYYTHSTTMWRINFDGSGETKLWTDSEGITLPIGWRN